MKRAETKILEKTDLHPPTPIHDYQNNMNLLMITKACVIFTFALLLN
jgi:hypothetical protein